MKTKKLISLGITILSLMLASCSCDNKNNSSQPSNDSNNNQTQTGTNTNPPKNNDKVEKGIGSAGGEVKDESTGLSLTVPTGALSSNTNITIECINDERLLSSEPVMDFLGAAEFQPSGTTFSKPVTVSMNLTKTPKNSNLAVFCYYETDDVWEYVTDATINGNKATFEITHFSKYQVKDRTKDFLNEYTNIVRHAKANNMSDAEITEAFRDYLVNDKHIMDQYTTFNGYWYEPCGLKINGNYQINGKQGDSEALSHREGENNKIGDKYGLCEIDGATSNRQAEKSASQSSEIIDVLVIVEYSIIKPDIELTASKTKLSKGESATVNIRCHYTNVANFYDEYKDLDLAGYMLTITRPTHFTVDKTSVLTDSSGRASFTVTAKEDDEAETITVNFDVSGDFGTHAEGNITLNTEGGYIIEGSIEEQIDVTYVPQGIADLVVTQGSFKLIINYDIEGSFNTNENELTGEINFINAAAKLSEVPCSARDDDSSSKYFLFKTINNVTPSNSSFNITGNISNGICSLNPSSDSKNIITINGSGESIVYEDGHSMLLENNGFEFTIKNSSKLLLDFAFEEEIENTYNSNELKDLFERKMSWEDVGSFPLDESGLICSYTYSTTQTITISNDFFK